MGPRSYCDKRNKSLSTLTLKMHRARIMTSSRKFVISSGAFTTITAVRYLLTNIPLAAMSIRLVMDPRKSCLNRYDIDIFNLKCRRYRRRCFSIFLAWIDPQCSLFVTFESLSQQKRRSSLIFRFTFIFSCYLPFYFQLHLPKKQHTKVHNKRSL